MRVTVNATIDICNPVDYMAGVAPLQSPDVAVEALRDGKLIKVIVDNADKIIDLINKFKDLGGN